MLEPVRTSFAGCTHVLYSQVPHVPHKSSPIDAITPTQMSAKYLRFYQSNASHIPDITLQCGSPQSFSQSLPPIDALQPGYYCAQFQKATILGSDDNIEVSLKPMSGGLDKCDSSAFLD